MNIRSIHSRLILWYAALIILTSVGFAAYVYASLHNQLYRQMQTTLTRRVEHVRDNILPQTVHDAQFLTQQIKEIYSPEESNRFVRITDAHGTILYVSGTPKDGAFNPAAVPAAQNYGNEISAHVQPTAQDNRLLIVGLRAAINGNDYVIEMGAPTEQIDIALRKLIVTLLIGLPAVILVTVIGGSVLVRQALRPVETIRSTAEKITYSNLRQRLPVSATGDALEHLSITLNQMLERLDQAYQQASRFSADASHELRTPLTIMRSELESIEAAMRNWKVPVEFRERVASIVEESERLSGIVEGLFSIARLDAGEAKIENAPFDLAALVKSTVEQMQLLAEEKSLSVSIDAPHAVSVTGDAARIKQVIVNLFDNAIKYTLPGGSIKFTVIAQGRNAVLGVEDNGIGIAGNELPHIFERFYRANKVRTRDSQGAGLGLSIVRAICQAHAGTIEISSKEGTGTAVTIELPLADKNSRSHFNAAA